MLENPFFSLLIALAIVLVAARIGGAIARRFDQSRVLGELLVGILLGPTVLDMLHTPFFVNHSEHISVTIKELAELGVLLLMFKVGLDVHIDELLRVGKAAIIAGILGALVPLGMVLVFTETLNISTEVAFFAGVTLAATSVSISAQVLLELGLLQTMEGNALLATALIDDVLAILLVSMGVAIFTGSAEAVDPTALAGIALQMLLFFIIAGFLAWNLLPRLFVILSDRKQIDLTGSYGFAGLALVFALVFGWAAQELGGVAFITGSFIAGVGLSRLPGAAKRQIDEAVNHLCYVFLVPIFFISIGLETDLGSFGVESLPIAGLLTAIAILSKILGCSGGALIGGFNRLQSLRLGVCMISRGEVGVIIASIIISQGILSPSDPFFASLFLVIILSTVVTPPAVRAVFRLGDDTSANTVPTTN